MTFMESFYRVWIDEGEESAKSFLGELYLLPIERVDVTDASIAKAGEFKAKFRMSVADCWILSLANEKDAILVHKDPEFAQADKLVRQLALPYK
jgi:predicted nucleic acid-binding protein